MQRLLIVAGEPSGDMHGAKLANALKKEDQSIRLFGVGGQHMQEAGVDLIHGISSLDVIGTPTFQQARTVAQTYTIVRRFLKTTPLDLVIFIDNPGLNLKLASIAKHNGVSVIYYVAPQIWAWHRSRVKYIANVVDHIITILPFEDELFRSEGVACTFVGHPLLDDIVTRDHVIKDRARKHFALTERCPVIAILPGSRDREVKTHLPLMLEALQRIRQTMWFQVILPIAQSIDRKSIETVCRRYPLDVKCIDGQAIDAMKAADLLLVASGTATLQGAFLGVPMIIVYRTSWITYCLARWLIQIEWIGLVNIVMGRSVVPELIQHRATPSRLAALIRFLLSDEASYQRMVNDLTGIRIKFGPPGAVDRAAAVIVRHLKKNAGNGMRSNT